MKVFLQIVSIIRTVHNAEWLKVLPGHLQSGRCTA